MKFSLVIFAAAYVLFCLYVNRAESMCMVGELQAISSKFRCQLFPNHPQCVPPYPEGTLKAEDSHKMDDQKREFQNVLNAVNCNSDSTKDSTQDAVNSRKSLIDALILVSDDLP